MAGKKDNQHNTVQLAPITMTLTTSPGAVKSAAIDIAGLHKVGWRLDLSAPLNPADKVHLSLEDSPDNITFKAVDDIKLLPTRNVGAHILVNPESPFAQGGGAFSLERYVKFVLTVEDLAVGVNVVVGFFGESMKSEFTGWDPNYEGDGQP